MNITRHDETGFWGISASQVQKICSKVSDSEAEAVLRAVGGDELFDEIAADPDGTSGQPTKKMAHELFGELLRRGGRP